MFKITIEKDKPEEYYKYMSLFLLIVSIGYSSQIYIIFHEMNIFMKSINILLNIILYILSNSNYNTYKRRTGIIKVEEKEKKGDKKS